MADIDSLANRKGRSLSNEGKRIIVRSVMWLQLHEGHTLESAIRLASGFAGSAREVVQWAVDEFSATL